MRCARARRLISLRGGADFFPVFFSRACVGGVSQPQSTPGTLSLSLSVCVLCFSLFKCVCVSLPRPSRPLGFLGARRNKKKKVKLAHLLEFYSSLYRESKKKRGKRVVSAKRETLEKLL